MTEKEAEKLRQWSADQMAWEREIVKQRKTKLPPIKGIRALNKTLKVILGDRKTSPQIRGKAASEAITEYVLESYGITAQT